ncbi:MAG: DUF4058 family protein [Planctomycetes bacterium]|nr:DUF4058 family protein [Planctomycetota bacterium]
MALPAPWPAVPAPLSPPDPDVPLDLQAAARACFTLVGYERLLNHRGPLPPPPLNAEEAAWAEALVRATGGR